jgi:hypothetical protein
MNLMLIARNKVAALAGLEVPTTSEIVNMERRDRYFVGEKNGPWPILFLGSDELVAGRDNKHMDFRLSVMKVCDGTGPSVVVHGEGEERGRGQFLVPATRGITERSGTVCLSYQPNDHAAYASSARERYSIEYTLRRRPSKQHREATSPLIQ